MLFYTEQQVETWLERETRYLPMPSGSWRPHTTFKLVWETMDSLIVDSGYCGEQLVEFAIEEAYLQRLSFDDAFTGVISWLDDQRRRQWGV